MRYKSGASRRCVSGVRGRCAGGQHDRLEVALVTRPQSLLRSLAEAFVVSAAPLGRRARPPLSRPAVVRAADAQGLRWTGRRPQRGRPRLTSVCQRYDIRGRPVLGCGRPARSTSFVQGRRPRRLAAAGKNVGLAVRSHLTHLRTVIVVFLAV